MVNEKLQADWEEIVSLLQSMDEDAREGIAGKNSANGRLRKSLRVLKQKVHSYIKSTIVADKAKTASRKANRQSKKSSE